MSLFEIINCICCGKEIKALDNTKGIMIKKLGPESFMWENGVVEKITAGYGSNNDGDVFYLGICDECINQNYQNGRLIYSGDCITFKPKFTEKELKKFSELKRRESNLNKLI